MQHDNPAKTEGFAFLEFCTNDKDKLTKQFESMGLALIARHKSKDVLIFQQNEIRFFINTTPGSLAQEFAEVHGPSVCAMGFKVADAQLAYEHVLAKGAKPYHALPEEKIYNMPAIYGVGGTVIYFVEHPKGISSYSHLFDFSTRPAFNCGLTYIDHVTHNLKRGNMDEWADFYSRLFNFRQIRYFDIEGKATGLKSRAMTSPCGKIRIPLNESSDDQSQIEEFIKDFKGEGIQHIALGTKNIYESVQSLREQGLAFLDTPDTYYEMIEKRLPKHGEPIEELKKLRILIDGEINKNKKLLLQIFTQNMLGPVFFEIIERKGDEGFGEGNFKALFESIELDQIRRGVVHLDKELA